MAENNDVLKKIKGWFVVEDETTNNTTATSENKSSNTTTTPVTTPPAYVTPPPVNATGAFNQKVYESLSQALENSNMQGFDYIEFKNSLASLAKMPMDEQTRYQSAYAMAQTMGADAKKLSESAMHYLNVLKNEELKFQQALDNQQKNGLASREQEMQGLQNAINQKSELLKQITQEIQQHQAKIEEIKQQMTDATQKIAQAQGDFHSTYEMLAQQIQIDIQNIQKYLN
jgi:chromosome segregation ATPase